jgi:hypothetical protein
MKTASKTILSFLVLLLLGLCFAQSSLATRKVLGVPEVAQEQDQWCWAGSSSAVLQYFKKTISQCYIADFGWTRQDCCPTPANCNAPK